MKEWIWGGGRRDGGKQSGKERERAEKEENEKIKMKEGTKTKEG